MNKQVKDSMQEVMGLGCKISQPGASGAGRSDWPSPFPFHASEKEMGTHRSPGECYVPRPGSPVPSTPERREGLRASYEGGLAWPWGCKESDTTERLN